MVLVEGTTIFSGVGISLSKKGETDMSWESAEAVLVGDRVILD